MNDRDPISGWITLTIWAVALVTVLGLGKCAQGAECPKEGIAYTTEQGNTFHVLYVPREAVVIAASAVPHSYFPAAVAFGPKDNGWIWADSSIPCEQIPWGHEMHHIDGMTHNASGVWNKEER